MAEKTPLYNQHVEAGGKIVEFAGWLLPVQYEGLRQEHDNVRKNVGLFDVSHMGEIRVKGERALDTVEWLTTNCVARLENGQAQYTLLPNEDGGVVDDLIVYCVEKGKDYFLCVNAANKDKDFYWIKEKAKDGCQVIDESPFWGQIAVQGPKAMALLADVLGDEVKNIPSFCFSNIDFQGTTCLVARTGYTGEDGCEIFISSEKTKGLWAALLDQGKPFGVTPCGLGARDTLRTEVKYPLYGHELDDYRNPYEAGLGWVIKPKLKDFLGKDMILAAKEKGLPQKLIGLKMLEKGIPRQGYKLISFDNEEIGEVTSGTLSPTLNEGIGIAYVKEEFAAEGSEFFVQIRNRQLKAQVVKTPFITPGGH